MLPQQARTTRGTLAQLNATYSTEERVCRHAAFDVPPVPRSAPAARDFCRGTLTGWGLTPLIDDAQVILSELVTNGVLHAGTPLGVTVSAATGCLELAVSDGSTTPPEVRPRRNDLAADLDELIAAVPIQDVVDDRDPRLNVGAAGSVVGGRGMQLVTSLAADWGVDLHGNGKAVWARLPVPQTWIPAASCACASGDIRLSSGAMLEHRSD